MEDKIIIAVIVIFTIGLFVAGVYAIITDIEVDPNSVCAAHGGVQQIRDFEGVCRDGFYFNR